MYSFERVEKEFGKDVLDRVLTKGKKLTQDDYDNTNTFVNLGKTIEIGGSGKNSLYDKVLPAYLKKYAKKWNAKVYEATWDGSQEAVKMRPNDVDLNYPGFDKKIPMTVLELNQEMKTGVTSSSQPLFEIFGTVSLSTWAANEVSDNMKNNIISQTTN